MLALPRATLDLDLLQRSFEDKASYLHFAYTTLITLVRDHWEENGRLQSQGAKKKPLYLSFFGGIGTGKSYTYETLYESLKETLKPMNPQLRTVNLRAGELTKRKTKIPSTDHGATDEPPVAAEEDVVVEKVDCEASSDSLSIESDYKGTPLRSESDAPVALNRKRDRAEGSDDVEEQSPPPKKSKKNPIDLMVLVLENCQDADPDEITILFNKTRNGLTPREDYPRRAGCDELTPGCDFLVVWDFSCATRDLIRDISQSKPSPRKSASVAKKYNPSPVSSAKSGRRKSNRNLTEDREEYEEVVDVKSLVPPNQTIKNPRKNLQNLCILNKNIEDSKLCLTPRLLNNGAEVLGSSIYDKGLVEFLSALFPERNGKRLDEWSEFGLMITFGNWTRDDVTRFYRKSIWSWFSDEGVIGDGNRTAVRKDPLDERNHSEDPVWVASQSTLSNLEKYLVQYHTFDGSQRGSGSLGMRAVVKHLETIRPIIKNEIREFSRTHSLTVDSDLQLEMGFNVAVENKDQSEARAIHNPPEIDESYFWFRPLEGEKDRKSAYFLTFYASVRDRWTGARKKTLIRQVQL